MESNLKPCEFRDQRRLVDGREETVCKAAGGVRLAVSDDTTDNRLEEACAPCPIPDVIAHDPSACLFLRPLRFLDEPERAPAYFTCRWYYAIRSGEQPTDIRWCHGCRDWFPRPPLELIQGHEQEAERIRRFMRTGDDGRPRFRWSEASDRPPTLVGWQRLRLSIQRWALLIRLRLARR